MKLTLFLLGEALLALLAWHQTRQPALRRGFWAAIALLLAALALAGPVLLDRPRIDIHAPLRAIFGPLAESLMQPRP